MKKMNKKKVMTLREEDLHFLVSESVNILLKENMEDEGVGQFFQNARGFVGAWNGNRKIKNAVAKIKKDLEYLDTMAQNYNLRSLDSEIQNFNTKLDALVTQATNKKDIAKSNMWDLRTQQQKDTYNQLTASQDGYGTTANQGGETPETPTYQGDYGVGNAELGDGVTPTTQRKQGGYAASAGQGGSKPMTQRKPNPRNQAKKTQKKQVAMREMLE